MKLWDVCTDQEAVDLVRTMQDPQAASKALVDHALARFSTDNLSCMIVRFDSKAVQEAVEKNAEPIGVEGDPASKAGGLSEAEHLVLSSKKVLDQTGEGVDRVPSEIFREQEQAEPGPEVNYDALKEEARRAARKYSDNKS